MEEIIPFTVAEKNITHLKLNSIRNVQEIYKENNKTSKGFERRFGKQAERLNNVRMQAIPKLIYKLDAISIKIPLEFILYSLCIACLFWNSSRVERKNHKRLLRDIYATIC